MSQKRRLGGSEQHIGQRCRSWKLWIQLLLPHNAFDGHRRVLADDPAFLAPWVIDVAGEALAALQRIGQNPIVFVLGAVSRDFALLIRTQLVTAFSLEVVLFLA